MQLYDKHPTPPQHVLITNVLYTPNKQYIERVKTITNQHYPTNVRRSDVIFLPEEEIPQPNGSLPDIFLREDIIAFIRTGIPIYYTTSNDMTTNNHSKVTRNNAGYLKTNVNDTSLRDNLDPVPEY
jgi:hypothetical protein